MPINHELTVDERKLALKRRPRHASISPRFAAR